MSDLGLETGVVDAAVRQRTIARFRREGWRLPTFAELAAPETIPSDVRGSLRDVDPDAADARNLFRVHWHNAADRRGFVGVPGHLVLHQQLTGVPSPIVLLLGDRFPMITAHKVLAAYACLVPRLISGRFDPERHRAIWPSTGNYCRGGVAISRTLGCRGVAVLPEGMSEERFEWLGRWVDDPSDVIRTPGSESNVKEIYDACAALAKDEGNLVFNQFCEFANHLVHWRVTGPAFSRVYQELARSNDKLKLAAFVSATGSAGTIAAGDYLKDHHGSGIVAVEALECPTMLYNGFGEHNIQGIGDKHIPLIHNVTNTDVVAAVSDRSTDSLNLLFNTEVGRDWLRYEHGLSPELVDSLKHLGLSSICNLLAAIQYAKRKELGPDQVVMTVATDGASLYRTEERKALHKLFPGGFGRGTAEAVFQEHLVGVHDGHLLECGMRDRDRIFNLGYFTWVEQQGVSLQDFERRRHQDFWRDLRGHVEAWDAGIAEFNREAGDGLNMPAETALVCAACGERVDPRAHPPFRCPRSGDDRDHLLNVRLGSEVAFTPVVEEAQPFARYASMLWGFDAARSRGWSASRFANSVQRLDAALEDVAGVGLRCTGPQRSDALSDALGCSADGGVWVVDETNQPSGSHKARHLFGVALWIDVAEALGFADGGDPLAVASCGNAALAAANLALAAGRELLVFVPEQASADTLAELRRLDAEVVVCPREEDDPPGDPCVHRFHEALADGALPFSCQGTENGLVVEGARTIAWDAVVAEPRGFDRVQLQVGGGAFASGFAQGAEFAVARGAWPKLPRILAVQSAAVSPLAPAWRALAKWTEEGDLDAAVRRAAGRRAAAMRPVEHPGTSVAEGILDDETYDWLELARLGIASGGAAQVVSEDLLREAHRLGREATGIDVCATGTAGLAGLLLDHAAGKLDPHERALVVFTGARR